MCGPLEGPRVCCIALGLHCNTAGRALDYPQGAAAKAAGKACGAPPHNSDVQLRPAPRWGSRSAPPGPGHRDRHGPDSQSPRGPEPQAAHDKQQAKQQTRRGELCSVVYLHTPGLKTAVRGVVWSFLVGETPWP